MITLQKPESVTVSREGCQDFPAMVLGQCHKDIPHPQADGTFKIERGEFLGLLVKTESGHELFAKAGDVRPGES